MKEFGGFVKIYRKFRQWGWYQDHAVKCVFLHLLLTANFKDGPWQGRVIKRGQAVVGTLSLANELGLTRQQIRTALDKLKSTNEITTETTNRFTVVTIVNWEEYQILGDTTTNEITSKSTNKQPTDNQQITTSKNEKKEKKEKNKSTPPLSPSENGLSEAEKAKLRAELRE